MQKTISVILPALNDARIFDQQIHALLAQTVPPNEIIVVDDHSVDNTKELAKSIQEENMCIIELNRVGAISGSGCFYMPIFE